MDNTAHFKLPFSLRLIRKLNFPRKLGLLEKLYGRKIQTEDLVWTECANGVEWKLDLSDSCHRWVVYGMYEGGAGIRLALSKLKNGGIYVDSGANIGQWLLYLGHIDGLRSFAFEPVKSQRHWLKSCLQRQDNWDVNVLDVGLGSKDQELEIQCNGGRSTLNLDWYQKDELSRETIQIRRLDDVLESENVDCVNFWKLDVEGAELEAFKGADRYFKQKKVECVCFECHPSNYQEVMIFLDSHDYQVCDLSGSEVSLERDKILANTQDLVAMPRA